MIKGNVSFYDAGVPAGFPSPAEDFAEKQLDLNDYLIRNKTSTFMVKVHGNSMINAGIHDGDILVVDRSVEHTKEKVVLAVLNGEFTVKRLSFHKGVPILKPENDTYPETRISKEDNFSVWGVVTFSIHQL